MQFWENHYKKAEKNEPYVTCAEVYRFFSRENPNIGLDMSEFFRQSVQLGVGYKKCRKKSVFLSSPYLTQILTSLLTNYLLIYKDNTNHHTFHDIVIPNVEAPPQEPSTCISHEMEQSNEYH